MSTKLARRRCAGSGPSRNNFATPVLRGGSAVRSNDDAAVVDPRLVGRRRERGQALDVRKPLELDAAQDRRAEERLPRSRDRGPRRSLHGSSARRRLPRRLDRRRDDRVALGVRRRARALPSRARAPSRPARARRRRPRGAPPRPAAAPRAPPRDRRGRARRTRRGARRRGRARSGSGRAGSAHGPRRASVTRSLGRDVARQRRADRRPRRSGCRARRASGTSRRRPSRQVAVPAFSISTRAPPSAPARGSSSIQRQPACDERPGHRTSLGPCPSRNRSSSAPAAASRSSGRRCGSCGRRAGRSRSTARCASATRSSRSPRQPGALRRGDAAAGPPPRRGRGGHVRGHHDPGRRDGRRARARRGRRAGDRAAGPDGGGRRAAARPRARRRRSRPVLEAVRIVRARARRPSKAVIGFCGGPFTVAGYLVEGRPSRDFVAVKTLMYREPAVWHALMERLAETFAGYVQAQGRAPAPTSSSSSTRGSACSRRPTTTELVAPYSARILRGARRADDPLRDRHRRPARARWPPRAAT